MVDYIVLYTYRTSYCKGSYHIVLILYSPIFVQRHPLAYNSCRISCSNTITGNVFCYNTTSTYDNFISNFYTRHYYRVVAYKTVVANILISNSVQSLIGCLFIERTELFNVWPNLYISKKRTKFFFNAQQQRFKTADERTRKLRGSAVYMRVPPRKITLC